MSPYVHDNTEDEFTHFDFINAYLVAHGQQPANLDKFRKGSLKRHARDPRPAASRQEQARSKPGASHPKSGLRN